MGVNCCHRILILYAEVMEYLLAGISQFKIDYPDSEILLFELDDKKLTSFKFNSEEFEYRKKSQYRKFEDFQKVCEDFEPSIVLVSGRMHPHYLRLSKKMKQNGVYTVTLQDTQYVTSLRQSFIRAFSKLFYRRYFCGFWGAGSLQTAFGLSLGFSSKDIFEGVYTANTNVFKPCVQNNTCDTLGKNILYVGRFVEEKNFKMLIKIFTKVNKEFDNIHKLTLIGSSDVSLSSTQIKIHPFMPSNEVILHANDADIFCLPSKSEPWGVVIHEFALLGLPLLLSNKCGANTKFLINGYNGFSFDPEDEKDFEATLKRMLGMRDDELKEFGERSTLLGNSHNPKIWAATLNSILQKKDSDA